MDATTTKMMQGTTWALQRRKSHSEEAIELTAGQSELVQAIHSKIAGVLKNGEPRHGKNGRRTQTIRSDFVNGCCHNWRTIA